MMRIENRGQNLLKNQVAGSNVTYMNGYWRTSGTWSGWGNVFAGLGITGSLFYQPEDVSDVLICKSQTLYLWIEDLYAITVDGTRYTKAGVLLRWSEDGQTWNYARDASDALIVFNISAQQVLALNPAEHIPEGVYWYPILRIGAYDGCSLYVKNFILSETLPNQYIETRTDMFDFPIQGFGN